MSYGSGAGADLDAINFTDQCIPSFVSLGGHTANVESESYVP